MSAPGILPLNGGYSFRQATNRLPILSVAVCFILEVTLEYTSKVNAAEWCPRFSCVVLMSTPSCRLMVAYVCRQKSKRLDLMRHTTATLLLSAGENPKVVSER